MKSPTQKAACKRRKERAKEAIRAGLTAQQQIDAARNQAEAAENRCVDLEGVLKGSMQERTDLKDKLDQTHDEILDLSRRLQTTHAELKEEMETKIGSLTTQLDAERTANMVLRSQENELRERMHDDHAERVHLRKLDLEATPLRKRLATKTEELSQMRDRLNRAQQELVHERANRGIRFDATAVQP